jgi:2',3'-cyclic-nucleotide 2'-phosphodiesterase (5'-nucleotidase family)
LLPFDNALVLVDLTGAQLTRLLAAVTKARDAQSGAIITFKSEAEDRNSQLVAVALDSGSTPRERPIEPNRIYTIATIDYLVNRGGEYAILKEAQRTRPLNVTLRDTVIEHLRRETARGRAVTGKLDNRFRRETKRNAQDGDPQNSLNKPAHGEAK